MLPPAVVDALLRIEGETLVRKADWFAALGSTNDLALEWAAEADLELPRLIWAETQTAGRGRGAHVWWAAPGALTFSLIVDEASTGLRAMMWPQVSVLTGLAIAEALSEFVPAHSIGLKWPNDVQVHGRKICGILVEVPPGQPQRLVIGIGINVGNSFREAPADLQAIATSLVDLLNDAPPLPTVLLKVLQRWSHLARQRVNHELDLPTAWARYCALQDRRVRVTTGEKHLDGVCRGIDADGALWLETSSGRTRQLGGTVRKLDRD
ncbi:MAG TPA: biotin--[acetyl-CoA-carboxylase] ligase [Planctomycetaceae bacterium]|nr:biotin--[acetyl-CoA-carboxylase] ligase [Planctomycetaceae bacterium]